ncbi:TIGR03086 family metal-binding protein [Actinomadura hibisca]|uniref:TIGR03086 family metal-binding protein n=1 Tax=Actinomadura hibisca TaxID=68565 RepID=UPI000829C64B|nr:TIGR03086 family metal-binding protein [Actinomadura hibisca]
MTDIRELDRRAVQAGAEIVAHLTTTDLDRPTPCEGWTARDLLAHMTAQHHGFAAAARGTGGDPAAWTVHPLGTDPVKTYTAAVEEVLTAFAEPDVLARTFTLAEFNGRAFPAPLAIGFHFIDYAVHGWDMARTLGLPYDLDEDLTEAALQGALLVPDDDQRTTPNAAFRPALPPTGRSPLDHLLAHLGRSPTWPN